MMTEAWSNSSLQVVRRVESNAHDPAHSCPLPPTRPSLINIPQAPQMAPLDSVHTRHPFTQQPPRLLSAGTDGAEALLLVDFTVSETCTSRYTGWGIWVWKMTKIGACQERGLYLALAKWSDTVEDTGCTLIFGMFSRNQTPHLTRKKCHGL